MSSQRSQSSYTYIIETLESIKSGKSTATDDYKEKNAFFALIISVFEHTGWYSADQFDKLYDLLNQPKCVNMFTRKQINRFKEAYNARETYEREYAARCEDYYNEDIMYSDDEDDF